MYSEIVMDHFKNPRNQGKIEDADGVGKVGNVQCGDLMWFYIKVRDGVIEDIKWETYGCAAAIAVSSIVSEMVKGKEVEEAVELTNQEILEGLGNLPTPKIHCSLLGVDALHEAIYDYLSKNKMEIPEKLEKNHERQKKILDKIGDKD
ncbi:MAG: iron-sulfur cluster assembly scaffold protein [archaeon]|nr:MAG: iron-sulfur cluster assembly scaffold protein [archaeon]